MGVVAFGVGYLMCRLLTRTNDLVILPVASLGSAAAVAVMTVLTSQIGLTFNPAPLAIVTSSITLVFAMTSGYLLWRFGNRRPGDRITAPD